MKVILAILLVLSFVALPVSALEIEVPSVPDSGADYMPDNTESFSDGLLQIIRKAYIRLRPDCMEAAELCGYTLCAVLIVSVFRSTGSIDGYFLNIAGCMGIASVFLSSTKSMLQLASTTILELTNYGKLLTPVMTAAMAAQGGITSSQALYVGTAFFNTVLGSIISSVFIPAVYFYLVLSVAATALDNGNLKNIAVSLRKMTIWCLKTLLIIFTTYMSITGVITGTTDTAALKATKVTISSVVPVVGGILSDASEAILVSAGVIKNAAGIYGILAALAVCIGPFLRIGVHYLLLKVTAALCSLWGEKNLTGMIDDFAGAMGLLLAMTGAVCLLLLVSTVCFLKGMN